MEDFNFNEEFERFKRRIIRDGMIKGFFENFNQNPSRDGFDELKNLLFTPRTNIFDEFFNGNHDLSNLNHSKLSGDGWIGDEWSSPDGKTKITSFTRSIGPEEFYHMNKKTINKKHDDIPTDVLINMLEYKLDEALSNEEYEEAAKLRDTIKTLKEEPKKD